jgi:hypothetical protein
VAFPAPVGLPSPPILPLPLEARKMAPLLLGHNNHPVPPALLTLGRPRPSPSYAALRSVGLVPCCPNSSSLSSALSALPRLALESSGNAAGKSCVALSCSVWLWLCQLVLWNMLPGCGCVETPYRLAFGARERGWE